LFCPPEGTVAVRVVDDDTVTLVALRVEPLPDVGMSWTVVPPLTNPIPVTVMEVLAPPEVGLTLATTGVSGTNVKVGPVALVPPAGKVVTVT